MEVLVADYGRSHDEPAMLEHFADMAKVHVANSNGLLGETGVDPINYPSQTAYYLGNNKPSRDPNMLQNIARAVNPQFQALQECLDGWEAETGTLRREAENLKKGMNLLIATNHSSLPDIGYVLTAFGVKTGRLNDPELQQKMQIMLILSKIVCFMGLNIPQADGPKLVETGPIQYDVTVAEILSNLLCDHVFLSVPQTARVKESVLRSALTSHIFKSFTEKHNSAMTNLLFKVLDKGGVMGGAALSGTTDKPVNLQGKTDPLRGDKSLIRLAPITKGTARIMMHERTKILPVAVLMGGPTPKLEVCDIPKAVSSPEAADEVMRQISEQLNGMDPTKVFEYYSYDELAERGEALKKSPTSAY